MELLVYFYKSSLVATMNFLLLIFASLAVGVCSAPMQVSDNNIGDIITLGVKADLNLTNQIDATKFDFLAQFRNLQNVALGGGGGRNLSPNSQKSAFNMPAISPEMFQNFGKLLSESQ